MPYEDKIGEFTRLAIEWNLNTQWTKSRLRGFIPKVTFPQFKYIPYPEITGYGASLFSKLYKVNNDKTYYERAIIASDALLTLQLASGGFASSISRSNSPIYCFDHVVIANGLLDCYAVSHERKYFESAEKALDLLVKNQKEDGQIPCQIDSCSDSHFHFHLAKGIIPLLKIYKIKKERKYLRAAENMAVFTVTEFQKEDGGLRLDQTDNVWNRFHFLCYAVEGLIAFESISSLFTDNVERAGVYLISNQRRDGAINYSFTGKGNPVPDKVDNSATVQAARIFLFLFNKTSDLMFKEGAIKALEYLTKKQHKTSNKYTNGGLPFGYHSLIDKVCACSWATQFAADLTFAFDKQGLEITF